MKNYYRIILGKGNMYAEECYTQNYIGGDFSISSDLSNALPESWREFNKRFIPIYLEANPEKSRIAAGLSCGGLWTICRGIALGDIVVCPNGSGGYLVGEIIGDYEFHQGQSLPHRRPVRRYSTTIQKSEMSDGLRHGAGSIGTISDITKHANEIEHLIGSNRPTLIISNDETIEDPAVFALEKHLEDFLVANWSQTELGRNYNIFSEDGELVGQQYPSDTGPIDILAISKDKKEILIVELKRGRVSDVVVGQIQRYMGYIKDELAEPRQVVKGVIIGLEDDIRIRRALSATTNIEFYKYQISFKLIKG